jgi:hypothetical protein
MNRRALFRFIVGFLKDILLIDAAIFVGAALLCLVFGGRTIDQYGQWLMWVGIATVVIGVMGFVGGGATSRGSVDYQLGQSAGQENIGGRTTQLVKDLAQSYAFTIRMTVVGIIALGVGILLQELFG